MRINFEYIVFVMFCILIALIMICIRQIYIIWKAKKQGKLGAKFQMKLAMIFLSLVLIPTIFISFITIIFIKSNMNIWFNSRIKKAVNASKLIAESYLNEHKRILEYIARYMAFGLDQSFNEIITNNHFISKDLYKLILDNRQELHSILTLQTQWSATEAIIVSYSNYKNIIAKSNMSFTLEFEHISNKALLNAQEHGLYLFLNKFQDKILAIIPIFEPLQMYLIVSKKVDPNVLKKIEKSSNAVGKYNESMSIQDEFTKRITIFVIMFILFITSMAIISGFIIAKKVILPIGTLINTAEAIKSGKWQAIQLSNINHFDKHIITELSELISVFNEMVIAIEKQKQDLINSNKILINRSIFIESVLSNISSGVISVSHNGTIVLANERAIGLLHQKNLYNKNIVDVINEFTEIFENAKKHIGVFQEKQIERLGKIFNIHALAQRNSTEIVITFDEISEIIETQRKVAWSDVARRVAHEIKNPLTPIVLSAERIKRKYRKIISESEIQILNECTEIIINQVGYIGKLISEFALFARMPSVNIKIGNISDLLKQTVILFKNTYPNIKFIYDIYDISTMFDFQQINQVFINIIKNSAESIGNKPDGEIEIKMFLQEKNIVIEIYDNGEGIMEGIYDNKIALYKTTKESGSGLGLSIVLKIIQDHNGSFSIKNRNDTIGTIATIIIPKHVQ